MRPISRNAILGHIHLAAVGVNGPVRLNLCGTGDPQPACTSQPSGTGVVATGTNGTTVGDPPITFDDVLAAMRSGGAYVNVHTATPGCTQGQPGSTPVVRFGGRSSLIRARTLILGG